MKNTKTYYRIEAAILVLFLWTATALFAFCCCVSDSIWQLIVSVLLTVSSAFVAYFITFTAGSLRYALTGKEWN